MTDRKPDYVFNVWGRGDVTQSLLPKRRASDILADNNSRYIGNRITHRIRVFMKDKRS